MPGPWTSISFRRHTVRGGVGAERNPLPLGRDRLRHQGRFHPDARLAAGGPSRRALARLGRDERRDDQDGHLRTAADPPLARSAAGVVGMDAGGHRRGFGDPRRALRLVAARPETVVGLPQRGKHRHHRSGARRRHVGDQLRESDDGGPGLRRRPAARRQPCRVQEPAVPRRGVGLARHWHGGTRSPGWTSQAHAGYGRDLPSRCSGNFRAAPVERLRERVPDLPRRYCGARQSGPKPSGLAVDVRAGRGRTGVDRRVGRRLLQQGFWHRVSGRAASAEATRGHEAPRRCDGRWWSLPACAC